MDIVARRCLLLLMGITLAPNAFAAESEKAVVAQPDQKALQSLVYTSRRERNLQLVLVKDHGTEIKQLTNRDVNNTYPAWSPNGKKIVFASKDSFGSGLFVMDIDGGNIIHLTHGHDTCAAWSPDGKAIAYTHHVSPGIWQIMTITIDDSSAATSAADGLSSSASVHVVTELTDGASYDADPAWSPDGKKIAFASSRSGGGFRLYVMDSDGKNVRDVSQTDNVGGNVFPAWSPDGKLLAYCERDDDGNHQIFAINADGNNKKQLTKSGNFNCYPAWSPDGRTIAYMSYAKAKSKGDLALMNPDGSQQTIITRDQGAGHNGRPAWKPK